MKLRIGAIALGLVALGCEQPPNIVPVAPPGMELHRMPPIPEGEGAQALGETPRETATQAAATDSGPAETAPPTPVDQPAKTPSGLEYVTLKEGTGPEAKPGQSVRVHYTGTFPDGKEFDSSRGKPGNGFEFRLGTKAVIPGWDIGVAGMRVGERRKLTVPPELGYGASGQPPAIPPNSTLIFDVELLEAR